MGDAAVIGFLIFMGLGILLLRLVGAWMLRINDVIRELQEIKFILRQNQVLQKPPINVEPPEIKKTDYV